MAKHKRQHRSHVPSFVLEKQETAETAPTEVFFNTQVEPEKNINQETITQDEVVVGEKVSEEVVVSEEEEEASVESPDEMEPVKVLTRRASSLNEVLGKFVKLMLLAGVIGTVIFSHWVYHGCSVARETSKVARIRELGTSCPTVGAIPTTPLQKLILHFLPFAEKAQVSSYGIGCRRQLFGNPTLLCESLFAISYLSTIAEWCMYGILAFKGIHRFIVKPIALRAVKVLLAIVVAMFVSRALLDFGRYVFPAQYFPQVAFAAQALESLSIQVLAFFWGTLSAAYQQMRMIASSDAFPGETLLLTAKAVWVTLTGRPVEIEPTIVHVN